MADLAPVDFWANLREWCRKLALAANNALHGVNMSVSSVTLTANQATTTVLTPYVTESSHITFTATTANAAGELATMYVSTRTNETSFVITHANNAQADRTFTYMISNP